MKNWEEFFWRITLVIAIIAGILMAIIAAEQNQHLGNKIHPSLVLVIGFFIGSMAVVTVAEIIKWIVKGLK